MIDKLKPIWSRAAPPARGAVLAAGRVIGLYLDDLLFLAAGVCFIRAAGMQWGDTAALAVAGVCCLAYALVIAMAKKGGGR